MIKDTDKLRDAMHRTAEGIRQEQKDLGRPDPGAEKAMERVREAHRNVDRKKDGR